MFHSLVIIVHHWGKPLCAHSVPHLRQDSELFLSDHSRLLTPMGTSHISQAAKSNDSCLLFHMFLIPKRCLEYFQLLSANLVGSVLPYNRFFFFFCTFQMPAFGFRIILWFPTHLLHPLIAPPALSLPRLPRLSPPFPDIPGSP